MDFVSTTESIFFLIVVVDIKNYVKYKIGAKGDYRGENKSYKCGTC